MQVSLTRLRAPIINRRRIRMSAQSDHLLADVASFPEKLVELKSKPAPQYVIFSTNLNESGLPWCPDCVRALPAVRSEVAKAGGSLLEVRVGEISQWKTPSHPFRSPPLSLKGVPTLVAVLPNGELGARAGPELESAGSPEEAASITAEFIRATSS